MKINGKMSWAHTITDGRNTYYIITDKRGDTEKGPLALLDGFNAGRGTEQHSLQVPADHRERTDRLQGKESKHTEKVHTGLHKNTEKDEGV